MSGRRAVTALDVARAAGVSRSAVSRTFTEGASVSEKTRQSVLEAALRLGYSPNAIARSLITQRSRMVGLVIGELTNPFFAEVLETFSEKLQNVGLRVLLFSIARVHDIDDALPALLQYQVDGVIITSAVMSSEMARKCAEAGKPVVLFNRNVRKGTSNYVSSDNRDGGRVVADFLVESGHRRIAFVAGTEETSTSVDRERGFTRQLKKHGLDRPLRDCGNFTYEGGAEAARRLLSAAKRPDAIFCADDVMALGVIDVARKEFSLRIPEDLSVVGFDDIPASGWPAYDLTTVRQRIEPMVDRAVEILLARIEQPDLPPEAHLVKGTLVTRGSARQPETRLRRAAG
ncbi:MAG: LacI family DNA-binding transcriptional regulator [Kiloniellales bacterium]|nr:LacI family DNA-binding transcriptional regulator [Kiloniellales bacterium]